MSNKMMLILCFVFLIVSHISISYASTFIEKEPQYVEKFIVKVYQKECNNYNFSYKGETNGVEINKLDNDILLYKDIKNNFAIKQKKNHYTLNFDDAKLLSGKDDEIIETSYSHNFEFDMDDLNIDKPENRVTLLDEENNIKVIIIREIVKLNNFPFMY